MKNKTPFIIFFSLLSFTLFVNKIQAQDSVRVWKMEYTYYIKSKLANSKANSAFLDIAKNKRVILFYTNLKYKLVYNTNFNVIGDLETKRSYSIIKNTAYEGLTFMPEEILAKGEYLYLFADDYTITENTDSLTIAKNYCTKTTIKPAIKNSNISYSIYYSKAYPPISWHPFSFINSFEGAFLGIERIEKNIKTEGIRLKSAVEINVPITFFNLPKNIKIIKLIEPPVL